MMGRTSLKQRIQTHSAFSLIEIMLVVVTLGIVASIGIPKYNNAVEKSISQKANVDAEIIMAGLTAYLAANKGQPPSLPTNPSAQQLSDMLGIHVTNSDFTIRTQNYHYSYPGYYTYDYQYIYLDRNNTVPYSSGWYQYYIYTFNLTGDPTGPYASYNDHYQEIRCDEDYMNYYNGNTLCPAELSWYYY